MNSQGKSNLASIVIEGAGADAHEVDAEVLGRVITGFQNITWVLAYSAEGLRYDERLRLSTELKKKYTLKVETSQKGSFIQPIKLPHQMTALIVAALSAVASENVEELQRVVPDSRLRGKLCSEVMGVLPKTGETWQMGYRCGNSSLKFDSKAYQTVKAWRTEALQSKPAAETLTIKGDLLSIDFSAKQVEVRYPPTKRAIKCFYLPEIEDSIIESRKGLIEVTGQFVLDAEHHPEKLTEVSSIQPVDLSEMTLMGILQQGGRKLEVIKPAIFHPTLDEDGNQLYLLEDASLNIHVAATTREELMNDLVGQIFFLWDTFGNPDPQEKLTNKAQKFGQELRKRFREN